MMHRLPYFVRARVRSHHDTQSWISSVTYFFFNDTPTTEIYTLSLHDALPIWGSFIRERGQVELEQVACVLVPPEHRSEEHTSELQSHLNLVCRLLLEQKK